jgi:hypothetical protein
MPPTTRTFGVKAVFQEYLRNISRFHPQALDTLNPILYGIRIDWQCVGRTNREAQYRSAKMNAMEVIEKLGLSGSRMAYSRSGNVVGQWDETEGRFMPIAGALMTGGWATMAAVRVNGQPMVADADWIEVPA